MSFQAVIERGRRFVEAQMTATCEIRRPGTRAPGASGRDVTTYTSVYDGKCRLKSPSGSTPQTRRVTVGEVETEVAVRQLDLPEATTGIRDGDLVAMTGGRASGSAFKILEATPLDDRTAFRLQVYEIPRPKEWT